MPAISAASAVSPPKSKAKPQTELEKLEVLIEQKKEQAHLPGTTAPARPLVVQQSLVTTVISYGYPKSYVIRSLDNDEANYCTTAYYLLAA